MLGEKIKALRKEKGMTQTELSQRLNSEFGLKTDRVMVSKWETGFQTPIFSTLQCLAELFGVSIDSLGGKTQEKDNVEAARNMGMHGIVFENYAQGSETLEQLLKN